jgi:alpha-mannosidase
MKLKAERPSASPGQSKFLLALLAGGAFVATHAHAQQAVQPAATKPAASINGNDKPTLYVIPYAHLDTQWRWEYPQTIGEFLPKTMRDNFALFEKYPHYLFNFSGANRYRMMKEYYPGDYEKVKQYVASGRWFPAGSSMEENDVNNPSAEAIIRQILYGKEYFRKDFGKTSAEYMLPDCFGFPASLPSILAHTGIKGFSTQKLSWHSGARVGGPDSPQKTPVGIPFNVGVWKGLDGKHVIAALNGTAYDSDVIEDLSTSDYWNKRNQNVGASSGLFVDYRYYGTGDTGGAPKEDSVSLMEAILTKSNASLPVLDKNGDLQSEAEPGPKVKVGEGPLHIEQTTAEAMFLKITPEQTAHLPSYTGDLELVEHSAGSLTSEAYMKRWNRKNELLADAAERASVGADWMGGRPYPLERLTNAWMLVMGGQFHDVVPGTATPKAYNYSWNDEVLAMNQFADVLTSATDSISSGLDTQVKGTAVVVYNPLNIAREDVVEANISFLGAAPAGVRVVGPDGKSTPGQIVSNTDGKTKVLFLAKAPSVGYAVYDVQPEVSAHIPASVLKITGTSLENARYKVELDKNGDVASFYDKHLSRELLSEPIRLAISTDKPAQWPAWNMDYSDQTRAPRAYVAGTPSIKIVENGPVRIALEITREAEDSKFVQTVRLSAGEAGNRLEFGNVIDWKTASANLKATFPLTASNPFATYNWDLGTIQRGNDDPKKYEVASHQWFDLTDKSGAFGVTVLSDCKNGSDKPSDNVLRLTLLRTPGTGRSYSDQATQDWGHHRFIYGLAGHGEDWRKGQTDWEAERLNQPLIAFDSSKHTGALGRELSLLSVSNPRVRVLALKKSETGDEVIVRLVELDGKSQQNVRIHFPSHIALAREVNGAEEPVGSAELSKGDLVTSFTAYQPRTFALKLAAAPAKLEAVKSQPVKLPYDQSVATRDGHPTTGGFDSSGKALPAEMLPTDLAYDGIHFQLVAAGTNAPNAVSAQGQIIPLQAAGFNTMYILAAAADGDQSAVFKVGDQSVKLEIEDWSGYIGQWDNRRWKTVDIPVPSEPAADDKSPSAERARRYRAYAKINGPRTTEEFAGLTPGFIKLAPVAWYASHRHSSDGNNEPYAYSYLYAYRVEIAAGASTFQLPRNKDLKILAVTLASEAPQIHPAEPLYDELTSAEQADPESR